MINNSGILLMVAGIITGLGATGESSASDSVSTSTNDGHEAVLKAINFALTGVDEITFKFLDEAACVVTNARPGTRSVDTFYLNAIDASHTKFLLVRQTTTGQTRVELHGESAIRETTLRPARQLETTLSLNTLEHDRVMRAWKYIYANGCTSAKSSF
jgi:hypothetical protein